MSMNTPGQLSPDGKYMWDGRSWVSAISPDGTWRWDGGAWVPHGPDIPGVPSGAAFSGSPAAGQQPVATPIPGVPPGPGAAQPPGYIRYGAGTAAAPRGLGYQFGGSAAWSIGFGVASILVPFFSNFYFPILPLFGLWRAVIAIRAGRIAGGVIGIVVNLVGGVVSLLASGLLH